MILFGHRWPIALLALATTMTNTFRLQVCTGHQLNLLHSHRKSLFRVEKTNECWNTRGFSRGALPIKKQTWFTVILRKGNLKPTLQTPLRRSLLHAIQDIGHVTFSTKLHTPLRYCNAYLSRLMNSTLWPSWQPSTQLTHIAKPSDVPHVVHPNMRKAQTAKVNVLLHSILIITWPATSRYICLRHQRAP